MPKKINPATQQLVKEHAAAFKKELLESFKTQQYDLLSKEEAESLTDALGQTAEAMVDPTISKPSVPLSKLNLTKVRARDLQKFLGLDDAMTFDTIGEVFIAYLKRMEELQTTQKAKEKYQRTLNVFEEPYLDYVDSRRKKSSPEEKAEKLLESLIKKELAQSDDLTPPYQKSEEPISEENNKPEQTESSPNAAGLEVPDFLKKKSKAEDKQEKDAPNSDRNLPVLWESKNKTSFWTPFSVTTALTPIALTALKKQVLCAGLTAIGINPALLIGVAAIGGIAGGLRAYYKNKDIIHSTVRAAAEKEGGGLKGTLKAAFKSATAKGMGKVYLRHAGKITLGVGLGIAFGGALTWGAGELLGDTSFCGGGVSDAPAEPARLIEDNDTADTPEEVEPPSQIAEPPEEITQVPNDPLDEERQVQEPAQEEIVTTVLDGNILLDKEADNDMNFVEQVLDKAKELGVSEDFRSAVEDKMEGADFVMSADSVSAVKAYTDALEAGLSDGQLSEEEYKAAVTALVEKLADQDTQFVTDIAGQIDDTQSYDMAEAQTTLTRLTQLGQTLRLTA